MSEPAERYKALAAYCINHRCEDCPMDDPQLGCIDDEDKCLVSLGLVALSEPVKR